MAKTALKLVLLCLLLNVVRYFVGGPLEAVTIMEPMHAPMSRYPDVFDTDFTRRDFTVSLGYNFAMWLVVTVVVHLLFPVLRGPAILRSLQGFGLMALFFVSLAAVYMNHYTGPMRAFYAWSMVDALLVFSLLGLVYGVVYPWLFPERARV